MPFTVILKQYPDNSQPNHFEYESQIAFNTRLDVEVIKTNLNNFMDALTKTNVDETYFVFNLENLEDRFDESVIGRVVTTRQLIDILKTDEFIEESADCSLLLEPITVTHYLIMQADVVYDTGLEDAEIEWTPDAFIEHYANSLWRIHD
jgi:UPF0288 family protein (methanogenesis marker protein 3)